MEMIGRNSPKLALINNGIFKGDIISPLLTVKIKKENIPKNIGRKYIIFLILFYNMQII